MFIDQAHVHRIEWRKLGIALVLATCVALLRRAGPLGLAPFRRRRLPEDSRVRIPPGEGIRGGSAGWGEVSWCFQDRALLLADKPTLGDLL